jgi:hypothetical protein
VLGRQLRSPVATAREANAPIGGPEVHPDATEPVTGSRDDHGAMATDAVSHVAAPPGHRGWRGLLVCLARRTRMRLTASRLDRQIAGAAIDSSTSETLALRVEHLIDPRSRRRLAQNLRGVEAYAQRTAHRPYFSAVMIEPATVRASSTALLGLADRLDGPDPVTARGVVLAMELLTDGANSPLFNPNCDRTVAEAVWEIADALGAGDPSTIERYSVNRW